jgi:hypothetical protein
MTSRVQVYRRNPDGIAAPAERLPDVYGGVWDTWAREYVAIGDEPYWFKVHPGQVRLIESFDQPAIKRTLALGSPGGGKSEGIITCALLLALWHPGKMGGLVAPTRARIRVVWEKLLKSIPPHWIAHVRPGDHEILFTNGSLLQCFAAKRQGRNAGSPFAGNDWFWAVEDEQQDIDDDSLKEVDSRGRINPNYQVFSSATNEPYGTFQRRIKNYEMSPHCKVVRFSGPDNAFTDLKFWNDLRATWDDDTYRRKVLCEDLPVEGRVYPAFSMHDNVKPRPPIPAVGRPVDITRTVTHERYGQPYRYVVGVDFGMRVNASVILQCYRMPGDTADVPTERQWWVVGEVVTEHKTPDWHARGLLDWFHTRGETAASFVAITGQDSNSTQPDKSDFVMFRNQGINITRASYSKRVQVHHRFAMVNALLHAADGKRRLFLDCDEQGRIAAKKTHDSFEGLRLNAMDKPETFGKGTRGGEDLTHYTDALGYALFPFEHFRGIPPAETEPDASDLRKRLDKRWESTAY